MTQVIAASSGPDSVLPVPTSSLIVRSPGRVDMAGITEFAKAMKVPVGVLSKAIYQAPSKVMDGVAADKQESLLQCCQALGLDVEFCPAEDAPTGGETRFDVAARIVDPGRIPHAIETLARVIGLSTEQAFRVLATPPGLIMGNISRSAAEALRDRFGGGIEITIAETGQGPFDLFLPQDVTLDRAIDDQCDGKRGLVLLGLDKDAADAVFKRLPKGSPRLIPRALIRFDLVMQPVRAMTDAVTGFLKNEMGFTADEVTLLCEHAPIAVEEGLTHANAIAKQAAARRAGMDLTLDAHGFENCNIVLRSVGDRAALVEVLASTGLEMPKQLPACIATDLPDLDARWIAHQIGQTGAQVLFEEATP